jgi:hypothetical protein
MILLVYYKDAHRSHFGDDHLSFTNIHEKGEKTYLYKRHVNQHTPLIHKKLEL